MATEDLPTAILYKNADETVILIDIPASNSLASQSKEQETTGFSSLISCPPLDIPHPSLEPKSERARANVLASNPPGENDALYKEIARQGLREIRAKYHGDWCFPRSFSELKSESSPSPHTKTIIPTPASESGSLLNTRTSILPIPGGKKVSSHIFLLAKPIVKASVEAISNRCVHNVLSCSVNMLVGDEEFSFLIPPRSMFTLGRIDDGNILDWSACARRIYPGPSMTAPPGQFDLVLVDPPWHNRSVSRGKKYQTSAASDVGNIVLSRIGSHIAEGGFLACWITNKPAVRASVLSSFDATGIELVEEWLWLKVTIGGEPVYAIDGLWRKPYEVLLIGRRVEVNSDDMALSEIVRKDVARRLVVGVPDIHSRKPSLKNLFETVLRLPSGYRALEIFARAVTTGWWSWGDEVLKYNDKRYWIDENQSGLPEENLRRGMSR